MYILNIAFLQLRRSKRRNSWDFVSKKLLTASYATLVPCIAWVAYVRTFCILKASDLPLLTHLCSQLRQQPVHSYRYSTSSYFLRTAAPFCAPLLFYMLNRFMVWLLMLIERREDRHLKKLDDAKKKLIKELKVRQTWLSEFHHVFISGSSC